MDKLPSDVLFEIIQYLTTKEIFCNFLLTSHSIHLTIIESPYFLGLLTKRTLKFSKDFFLDYSKFTKFQREITQTASESLRFLGFATSGGCDEDVKKYWVSNLFVNDGSFYCSRDNKNNINTASILVQNEIEAEKQAHDYILSLFKKCPPLAYSVYPRYNNTDHISRWQIEDLRDIYTSYRGELLAHLSKALEEKAEKVCVDLDSALKVLETKKFAAVHLRRRENDPYIMEDKVDLDVSNWKKTAMITKVEVCRSGGFTCPVKSFIVFVSEKYVDIEDEAFLMYDDLKTLENLERFKGDTYDHVEGEGVVFKEFKNSMDSLKPVVWGQFTESTANVISLNLKEKFFGNFLYLKLIEPENRMAEMNDQHEFTNIDCNYIISFGRVVELPR